MRRIAYAAALSFASLVGPGTWGAAPAQAVYDDTFWVTTTRSCGSNEDSVSGMTYFWDYGPGAPGGGDNDDYISILDVCEDRHGVRGYVWLNGEYLGSRYNGNGYGSEVVWDPFGNLPRDSRVGLRVCLVDGPDGAGYACSELRSHTLEDG